MFGKQQEQSLDDYNIQQSVHDDAIQLPKRVHTNHFYTARNLKLHTMCMGMHKCAWACIKIACIQCKMYEICRIGQSIYFCTLFINFYEIQPYPHNIIPDA